MAGDAGKRTTGTPDEARAVEIAIEDSEAAALVFLERNV